MRVPLRRFPRKGSDTGDRAALRRVRPEDDQTGFSLVEMVVALSLLATVTIGFALSIGFGFRAVATARQRQTASELTSARLEHLRSVPFEQVALTAYPTRSTDPENPDSYVSADGLSYDVSGQGDFEELIVDPAGNVLHLEDPVEVGSTVMEVYQYATWVDDPSVEGSHDWRRVTVVVRYKTPSITGVNKLVRASSYFTPGTVTVGSPTTTTTLFPTTTTTVPATTTTTAAPTTTTTAAGPCTGDVQPPTGDFTVSASGGAEVGFTAAANVTLHMDFDDSCTPILVRFSNDGSGWSDDVTFDPLDPDVSWSLAAGDGTKQIHARVRDGAGNERALGVQQIVLDTVRPTVPGTLLRTLSCSGVNRTAYLAWGTSGDTNFRGYRVYRSTDGTTWSVLATTSAMSYSDTHRKSLDSVRYYVVGYDKAGNESDATNTISLAKNQCS